MITQDLACPSVEILTISLHSAAEGLGDGDRVESASYLIRAGICQYNKVRNRNHSFLGWINVLDPMIIGMGDSGGDPDAKFAHIIKEAQSEIIEGTNEINTNIPGLARQDIIIGQIVSILLKRLSFLDFVRCPSVGLATH